MSQRAQQDMPKSRSARAWAWAEAWLWIAAATLLLAASGRATWRAFEGFGNAPATVHIYGPGAGGEPGDPFVVMVETQPEGAGLRIDDGEAVETPASVSVPCEEGAIVRLVIARPGYREHRRQVKCVPGRVERLNVALEPSRG